MVLDELRVLVAQDVVDRDAGVDVPRVDVVKRLLLRESLDFASAIPELRAGELHQVLGVALIHDREVLGEAGGGSVAAEQPVRGGVKGPAVHARARAADQPLGAREHLLRGAAREGEEQDALGRHAALDQVRDAVDERPRLARAGAGDDEQRTVAKLRGRLFGVELGGEVACATSIVAARSVSVRPS